MAGTDLIDQYGDEFDRWVELMTDPNPQKRTDGWDGVRRLVIKTRTKTPHVFLRKLFELKAREADTRVLRAADLALSMAGLLGGSLGPGETPLLVGGEKPASHAKGKRAERRAGKGRSPQQAAGSRETRLGDWLWVPFREPSLVVRVADPKSRLRDEEAVIELARRLAWNRFRRARFDRVGLGNFAPPARDLNIAGLAFVGRLGMYGDEAVRCWSLKECRFHFGSEKRPKDLPAGVLDPKFHSILESMGPDDDPIRYPTVDEDGKRTDYGLVQSYIIRHNGRDIRVVLCAGSSALGTLAACYWAGYGLFVPNGAGRFIMPPPKVKPDSCLEALLKVTAKMDPTAYVWNLGEMKLLDLRLDEYVWNEEAYDWDHRTAKRLTLLYDRKAGQDFGSDAVRDVLLDGKPSRMKKDNENFRLLVALCRLARDNEGCIDIDKLASDDWIWHQQTRAVQKDWNRYVRGRLWSLKKYHLGRALLIGDDKCFLAAEIRCRAE